MSNHAARNRQVVERYWEAHFLRDWDRMATFFSDDAHYTDVGVDGQGARGPQQIVDRLKIGIEPLSGYYHHPRHIVAEGDLVILEHVEEWQFHTGERILHPFVTVMEVRDGKIVRWHDYSNIGNVDRPRAAVVARAHRAGLRRRRPRARLMALTVIDEPGQVALRAARRRPPPGLHRVPGAATTACSCSPTP